MHKEKMELKSLSCLGGSRKGKTMKKLILMTVILMGVSGTAMAERQVYLPYPQPSFANDPQAQQMVYQQRQTPNTYMVYPGREQYGQNYGAIPRHPGDYRDAVDRGTWTGGGVPARRSFDIR